MAKVDLESVSGKLRGLRKRDLSVEVSLLEGEGEKWRTGHGKVR